MILLKKKKKKKERRHWKREKKKAILKQLRGKKRKGGVRRVTVPWVRRAGGNGLFPMPPPLPLRRKEKAAEKCLSGKEKKSQGHPTERKTWRWFMLSHSFDLIGTGKSSHGPGSSLPGSQGGGETKKAEWLKKEIKKFRVADKRCRTFRARTPPTSVRKGEKKKTKKKKKKKKRQEHVRMAQISTNGAKGFVCGSGHDPGLTGSRASWFAKGVIMVLWAFPTARVGSFAQKKGKENNLERKKKGVS